MRHPNILDPKHTALVVIDIQEGFRNAIAEFDMIAKRAATVVRGFQTLGLPVLVTEQYPNGLGHTADEITSILSESSEVFEKSAFSSCGADAFVEKLNALGIKQIVICGLETHVCVNQTAHDLITHGFQVHILTDCVCSRFDYNREAGLAKMLASGALSSSIEMALFELMSDSKHEKFKEIQSFIK